MGYCLFGEHKEVLQRLLAPVSRRTDVLIRPHCQGLKPLQRLLTNKLLCLGSELPSFTGPPCEKASVKQLSRFDRSSSAGQLQHGVLAGGRWRPLLRQCSQVTARPGESCRSELLRLEHDTSQKCFPANETLISNIGMRLQSFFSS